MQIMKMTQRTEGTLRAVLDVDDTLTAEEMKHIRRALGNTGGKQGRKLITTNEACDILGICSMTLRRYELKGFLKPIRYTQRKIRWDEDEIIDFKHNGKGDKQLKEVENDHYRRSV